MYTTVYTNATEILLVFSCYASNFDKNRAKEIQNWSKTTILESNAVATLKLKKNTLYITNNA